MVIAYPNLFSQIGYNYGGSGTFSTVNISVTGTIQTVKADPIQECTYVFHTTNANGSGTKYLSKFDKNWTKVSQYTISIPNVLTSDVVRMVGVSNHVVLFYYSKDGTAPFNYIAYTLDDGVTITTLETVISDAEGRGAYGVGECTAGLYYIYLGYRSYNRIRYIRITTSGHSSPIDLYSYGTYDNGGTGPVWSTNGPGVFVAYPTTASSNDRHFLINYISGTSTAAINSLKDVFENVTSTSNLANSHYAFYGNGAYNLQYDDHFYHVPVTGTVTIGSITAITKNLSVGKTGFSTTGKVPGLIPLSDHEAIYCGADSTWLTLNTETKTFAYFDSNTGDVIGLPFVNGTNICISKFKISKTNLMMKLPNSDSQYAEYIRTVP